MDDDGSGELDIQIGQLMETIGRNLNEKQLEQMMKEIDEDGSGLVEFDEYCMVDERSPHCIRGALPH